MLQFWVKCGTSFPLIGELDALLKEAVVKATFEAPLRHNSVETFDEYNTGKNVGKGTPTVFWDIVPDSDKCEIYTYMAGGGCTLPGKAMVLMPGAGYEGVTRFVMDVMTSYGLNACPPLLSWRWCRNFRRDRSSAFQESPDASVRKPQRERARSFPWRNFWKTASTQLASDRRVWAVSTPSWAYISRTPRKTSFHHRCSRKRRMLVSSPRPHYL